MIPYIGSKDRIKKEILPLILRDRKPNQFYVEPFVGGGNIISSVKNPRIGSDSHVYLVALLKAIQRNQNFPKINELEYNLITKNPKEYPEWLVGYVGFIFSFGRKWNGGFARGDDRILGKGFRDKVLKLFWKFNGIDFRCSSYKKLNIPPNSIIYCDPPYRKSNLYKCNFNTDRFWFWCYLKIKEGHKVFVSEYEAPKNWKCIWSKNIEVGIERRVEVTYITENLYTCHL